MLSAKNVSSMLEEQDQEAEAEAEEAEKRPPPGDAMSSPAQEEEAEKAAAAAAATPWITNPSTTTSTPLQSSCGGVRGLTARLRAPVVRHVGTSYT
jgi:hypothetical protein